MWKYVDEIHSMNPKDYRMLNKCPICQKILFPAYTLVPVTVSDCAEIDGKECISCNRIYVEDCEERLAPPLRDWAFKLTGVATRAAAAAAARASL